MRGVEHRRRFVAQRPVRALPTTPTISASVPRGPNSASRCPTARCPGKYRSASARLTITTCGDVAVSARVKSRPSRIGIDSASKNRRYRVSPQPPPRSPSAGRRSRRSRACRRGRRAPCGQTPSASRLAAPRRARRSDRGTVGHGCRRSPAARDRPRRRAPAATRSPATARRRPAPSGSAGPRQPAAAPTTRSARRRTRVAGRSACRGRPPASPA